MVKGVFGVRNRMSNSTVFLLILLAISTAAYGQDSTANNANELAKKLSNPVASLISVPFQNNWHFNVGAYKGTQYLLNFQPVIPISLDENWNLIARVIVPFVNQPLSGGDSKFGMSDILASAFFSPAKPGDLIWGVGPVFSIPTATDDILGSGKFSIGPTILGLTQQSGWTIGLLANQVWSIAGKDNRADVNQTFLQPFVSYGAWKGGTLSFNTEAAANWKASSGEQWTVPLNISVSQILPIGGKPVSFAFGYKYFAAKPTGGPDWGLRAVVTLLFPK